jgi:hypothetical protein
VQRSTCLPVAMPSAACSLRKRRLQRAVGGTLDPVEHMSWTDLFARACDSDALSQWLLDSALGAMEAAHNSTLDAVIAAELPTPAGLCAALDAHGVDVPNAVFSKFHGHSAPRPAPEPGSDAESNWIRTVGSAG